MATSPRLTVAQGDDTLVDTCVLLDVLTDDATWAGWSERAIRAASDTGGLVINPIVYAEVAAGFDTIERSTRCCRTGCSGGNRCRTTPVSSPPGRS